MKRARLVSAVVALAATSAGLVAVSATTLPAAAAPSPGDPTAAVFSCTNGYGSTYVPPAGVDRVRITAIGGAGSPGQNDSSAFGRGAVVSAVVPVTPGEAISADAGCASDGRGAGAGYSSGGDGGVSDVMGNGGGGGGASAVLGGPYQNVVLVVAGGGGGGGGYSGLARGGCGGGSSQNGAGGCSGGGSGSAGHGRGGILYDRGGYGTGSVAGGGGGGGGGGYFSGSGGRGGSCWGCSGGGGGGGSSIVLDGATEVSYAGGAGPVGDGSIVIVPVVRAASGTVALCDGGKSKPFTVPAGANQLQVVALGASGGDDFNTSSGHGAGGRVDAVLPVKGGEQLSLVAGCAGQVGNKQGGGAGYGPGGGGGAPDGAGGGGGDAVLLGNAPLVIAGGGGGAGGGGVSHGNGGGGSAAGDPGTAGSGTGKGGGGAGGSQGGHDGQIGEGGGCDAAGGGGGGGGARGGGRGGRGACYATGGGGGGGSSMATVPNAVFAGGANAGGDGLVVVVASAAVAPGPPTSLRTQGGNQSATVFFSAPIDDGGSRITAYTISGGPNGPVTVTTEAPGYTTIAGLTNGVTYTFSITATNGIGTGPAATVSATPATTPGIPTDLDATAGDSGVALTFTAPSTGGAPIIYDVLMLTPPYTEFRFPDPGRVCLGGVCTTTLFLEPLTNGQQYLFAVRALNRMGPGTLSEPSNLVTPQGPATVPGAPLGVTAAPGQGSVSVAFAPPASNGGPSITSYAATCTASAQPTVTKTGASSPLLVSGLTAAVQYSCTVRAANSIGLGPASSAATATPTATGAPGVPTGVSWSRGNGFAQVTYSAPLSDGGSAITGYTATCTGPGPTQFTNSGPATPILAIQVFGLTNGTTYSCTVHASNGNGTGIPSFAVNVVPATTPSQVAKPVCTAGPGSNVTVSFTPLTPPADGGSPILQYQAFEASADLYKAFGTTSPIVVGPVAPGTYQFSVAAGNALGYGTESAACDPVTIP